MLEKLGLAERLGESVGGVLVSRNRENFDLLLFGVVIEKIDTLQPDADGI